MAHLIFTKLWHPLFSLENIEVNFNMSAAAGNNSGTTGASVFARINNEANSNQELRREMTEIFATFLEDQRRSGKIVHRFVYMIGGAPVTPGSGRGKDSDLGYLLQYLLQNKNIQSEENKLTIILSFDKEYKPEIIRQNTTEIQRNFVRMNADARQSQSHMQTLRPKIVKRNISIGGAYPSLQSTENQNIYSFGQNCFIIFFKHNISSPCANKLQRTNLVDPRFVMKEILKKGFSNIATLCKPNWDSALGDLMTLPSDYNAKELYIYNCAWEDSNFYTKNLHFEYFPEFLSIAKFNSSKAFFLYTFPGVFEGENLVLGNKFGTKQLFEVKVSPSLKFLKQTTITNGGRHTATRTRTRTRKNLKSRKRRAQ